MRWRRRPRTSEHPIKKSPTTVLFANATDLQLDRQGRILVPAELRAHAGLEREAVVVGMHTFIEIWSPEGWANQDALVEREGASIAEKLAALV